MFRLLLFLSLSIFSLADNTPIVFTTNFNTALPSSCGGGLGYWRFLERYQYKSYDRDNGYQADQFYSSSTNIGASMTGYIFDSVGDAVNSFYWHDYYTCEAVPDCTVELNNPDAYWDSTTQQCKEPLACTDPNTIDIDPAFDTVNCVPYDENTTNTDGTCMDGNARASDGFCRPDDDGDGVPNVDDDFPTDSTRTDGGDDGSNNDTGKDCSAYCGIDNPQDCMDTTSISSSRTPIAEVGYIDCSTCSFRVDEQFDLTCDEFFGLQAEEPLPEIDSCLYENSIMGFAFQSITPDNTSCTLLIKANAQDGKGYKFNLPNCSQGSTACYYNPKIADEQIMDTNTTDGIDDSGIIEKLEEVKDSVNDLNLPLGNIDDSIKNNTKELKESLDSNFNDLKTSNTKGFGDVEKSVTEGTNTIGTKIDSMNDNIGTKLNGITDAINSKETFPQESEGILQYDDIEVDSMLGGSNSGLEAQFNSFTEGYATDLFSLQSVTLPVSPNCGCTDPSIDITMMGQSFHQDVEVCSSLDSLFAVMRPLLWFAFLVTTLFGFFRKD